MAAHILRRFLLAIPVLLVASMLTFLLSRWSGASYFDQYRADPRLDPAVVREMERRAHFDQPPLVQYLNWLRGIVFDVRVFRPEHEVEGFEGDAAEIGARIRLVEGSPRWRRSTQESESGRAALLVEGGEAGGALELATSVPPEGRFGALGVHALAETAADAEIVLLADGRELARAAPEPGHWRAIEAALSEPPPREIAVRVLVPAGARLYLDDLALIDRSFQVSLGAPDFGRSLKYDTPVFELLQPNLFNTFLLATLAMLVTWSIALPLGIHCAVHRHGLLDRTFSGLAFLGMSTPGFFLALLVLYFTVAVVNTRLGFALLPTGGSVSGDYDQLSLPLKILDRLRHLVLPVLVLTAGAVAELQRITRGNLLEVLRAQYVTVARAKGLPERTVIYKHAFVNALNPLVSIFGYRLSSLLSGAALVEIVFSYPGMGKVILDATLSHDLYVMMAGILVGAVLLIAGNLLADLILMAIDPRIQFDA
jgi:peptide/nickel transport system permease protein